MTTPSDPAGDYQVVTRQDGTTKAWGWEILRRSKPLGVRLQRDGFASESAAKLAGEKVLEDLLDGLAEEDKNRSSD